MATPRDAMMAQLERINMIHRADEFLPIFECTIDVGATVNANPQDFHDFTEYMDAHIQQYALEFEDCDGLWVPIDLLKHIFREDKNFRFRLARFIKGLTERDIRQVDIDCMMDLGVGNIGDSCMEWNMVLVFLIQQGVDKDSSKGKKKEQKTELQAVYEVDAREELLTEAVEASLALVAMSASLPMDEPDNMIEGDEVLEEVPELAIFSLQYVLVDGKEYLFLDDIAKTLGLREDEALGIVSMYAGMQHSSSEQPKVQIDFEDNSITRALTYGATERTLEDLVVNALVTIKEDEAFYASVPEAAFLPPEPMLPSNTSLPGSIDLTKKDIVETDNATETAYEVDKFAMRTGGSRGQSEGKDSSLWHYLPYLRSDIVRIIHLEYSPEANAELHKCKALSTILSEDSLASNAHKCILVNREAALFSFTSKHRGSILGHCALSVAQGIENPHEIVKSLGETSTSRSSDRIKDLLRKL